MALVPVQKKDLYVIRMVDGANMMKLEPSTLAWSLRLNKAGEISADARIAANEVDYNRILQFTDPKKYGLLVEINDRPVEAGQIVSRTFADDAKSVSLRAPGIWTYTEWLKIHNMNFDYRVGDPKLDDVTFSNMSWRGIAGALIMRAVFNSHNDNDVPPFVCDFTEEPGNHSMTFKGADFKNIGAALTEITTRGGGSDLGFVPEWTSGSKTRMQWRLVGGEPLLHSYINNGPPTIDHTLLESPITTLGVDEDGTAIATRVWAKKGSDTVVMGANSSLIWDQYPLMEVDASFDVADIPALTAALDQKLLDSSSSMSTWSMSMITPDVTGYMPGDFLNIKTKGHKSIRDGIRLVRLVGVDGDHSQKAKYHVQPMLTDWYNFDPSKVQRAYHEPDPVRANAEQAAALSTAISNAARTGGIGSGSGGGLASIELATVDTADNASLATMVKIGAATDSVAADNYIGRILASGDDVVVGTTSDGKKVLLGKGLSSDGTPGSWGPLRVSLGYPLPTGSLGMATSSSPQQKGYQCFEDIDDALGFGPSAKYLDMPSANNVYPQPSTGVFATTGTPGPDWSWLPRSSFFKEGKFFQWFTSASKGYPYLFKWDRVAHTWSMVPGLPDTRNVLIDGYWRNESVKGEILNMPLIAMVTADKSAIATDASNWHYRGYITIWQVKPDGSGWYKSAPQGFDVPYNGYANSQPADLTSSSVWMTSMVFNNFHCYVKVYTDLPNSSERYYYVGTSDGMTTASIQYLYISKSGNDDWYGWFATDAVTYYKAASYRVALTGELYYASAESDTRPDTSSPGWNRLRVKAPGGAMIEGLWADGTAQAEPLMYDADVVHVGGSRYIVNAKRASKKGTNKIGGVVMEYDLTTNAKSELVPDATPDGATTYSGTTYTTLPVVLFNGDVVALCANSTASPWQSSEAMYKFTI